MRSYDAFEGGGTEISHLLALPICLDEDDMRDALMCKVKSAYSSLEVPAQDWFPCAFER